MGKPTSMSAKAEEIRRILSEPVVDLWRLRELALSEGGLVNDSLRKLAWPKLVGVKYDGNSDNSSIAAPSGQTSIPPTDQVDPPNSLDAEQITRDVSRVTWHLLTGNQRSRNFQMKNKHRKRIHTLLKRKQKRLGDFLNLVLVQSYGDVVDMDGEERLRYYQGFHDVASIVLSALGGASTVEMTIPVGSASSMNNTTEEKERYRQEDGEDDAAAPNSAKTVEEAHKAAASMGLTLACQVLLQLTQSHLRDAMRTNFQQLNAALRLVIMPLTAAFDPELHSHLFDCEMEPFFALSWIITWFSHDVRDTAMVKRLFDFFLVSHPMMSIYMSVAMMIHPLNRIEILSTDCDFACVHHALADLPKNSSNVGWKYTPADGGSGGYVSGDDDDLSLDASLLDQSCDDAEEDGSVISSSVLNNPRTARVPFQELIDLSISLMHKIPPRNLINLAKRYHTEITLQPLMAESSSITLLQPPPSWGLSSYADSDWVLRQKLREELGIRMNRHQRRNRFKLANGMEPHFVRDSPIMEEGNIKQSKKKHDIGKPSLEAIIASGTGPDGRAEARKMKKQRRMMVRGVAVVMLSIFVALVKPYFSSTKSAKLLEQQSAMKNLPGEVYKEASSSQRRSTADKSEAGKREKKFVVEKASPASPALEKIEATLSHDDVEEECPVEEDEDENAQVDEDIADDDDDDDELCPDDDLLEQDSMDEIKYENKQEAEKVIPSLTDVSQYVETNETVMKLVKLPAVFVMKTLFLVWSLRENLAEHLLSVSHQVFGLTSHLQPYFEFLMEQFIKVLRVGWHNADEAWSKIAPVLQKELMSELDGGQLESAKNAMQTWEKQGEMYKNQWKKLVRMASNTRKGSKAGKESLSGKKTSSASRAGSRQSRLAAQ